MRRLPKIALGLILLSLVCAGMGAAAWAISSNGTGYSKAFSMPSGSVPTKAISTYPGVAVSWTGVSVGGAGMSGYTIRRYSEAGVLQTIGAACSGAIAALTCTETATPVGRWQYTTQPIKGVWLGTESAKSTTLELAAPPSAIACTTCHAFGGATKYINNSTKASVTITVTLPASSLATDTVHLTLTDSVAATITPATQAAPAGGGTLTFSAINTTSLTDGAVTATAWVSANTGDLSSNTTFALVKDVVAPSAADEFGTNVAGGVAGKLDTAASDTLTYTFSEAMDPATIKATWAGTATAVTITFTNSAGNDAITSSVSLGSISTNTNFVTGNITNAATMVMTGNSVVVTFATAGWSATNKMATSAASTWGWTPVATPTDVAGNVMTTTARNQVGGPKTNF
jgi:hypothetical protein